VSGSSERCANAQRGGIARSSGLGRYADSPSSDGNVLSDSTYVDAVKVLGWVGVVKGPTRWQGCDVASVLHRNGTIDGSPLVGVLVPTDSHDGLRVASQLAGHAQRAILLRDDCRDLLTLRMASAVLNVGIVVYDESTTSVVLLDAAGPQVPALPSYKREDDPWFISLFHAIADAPTLAAN
jgi:hypothetical protein